MTPELMLGFGNLFGLFLVCALAFVNLQWMRNQMKWQQHQDKAIIQILNQLDELDK